LKSKIYTRMTMMI